MVKNVKLNLATVIFFALFCLLLEQTRIPSLHGGKCAMVKNSIYYLGGQINTDPSGINPVNNNKIYKLDLIKDKSVDSFNEANWQTIDGGSDAPTALFPAVVAESDSSPNIFMFGGQFTYFEKSFQKFDTSTNKWLDTSSVNKLYPPLILSNNQTAQYSLYCSTFVSSGGGDFIHYGGLVYNNDKSNSEARPSIGLYSSNDNIWTWTQNVGTRVYDHVACVYQNTMYVIGGLSLETLKPFPMQTIMTYDIPRARWINKTAQGDIPSDTVGASNVLVDNLMYMVGGGDDFNYKRYPEKDLHILDLKTLTWVKKEIKNFKPTYSGCLAYYKGNLIYSFGYNGLYSSSTQFIDLTKFEIVSALVDNNSTAKLINLEPENNLAAEIGGSIGGVLGFIIILMAVLFWRRHVNKRKNNELKFLASDQAYPPPEILKISVWSDGDMANTQLDNDINFSLDTATQVPDFDRL